MCFGSLAPGKVSVHREWHRKGVLHREALWHRDVLCLALSRLWEHEIVGEVVETGSAACALNSGTHVVVESIIFCGICYPCRQGRVNVCEQLKVLGVHIDGGCQEYILVPAANIHEVPVSLPWEEVVLLDPFTIGAQACYRGNVRSGELVLVMGAGTIGLTVAKMAKLAGAVVIITDLIPEKLQYAKSLGTDYTINVKEREISGGMGTNVTVDAVCNKKSFEDAVDITSAAGWVVELSFNEVPSDIAPVGIVKKELTIYGLPESLFVLGARDRASAMPEAL